MVLNWNVDPKDWNGLSRFINFLVIFIGHIYIYDKCILYYKEYKNWIINTNKDIEDILTNKAVKLHPMKEEPKVDEKSQEQIIFENICGSALSGDYRGHPFESVGNVIHWLRAYGLREYDTVQIGWKDNIGQVTLYGKLIATYLFDHERQLIIFTFNDNYQHIQHKHDIYIDGLSKFENPYKEYIKEK